MSSGNKGFWKKAGILGVLAGLLVQLLVPVSSLNYNTVSAASNTDVDSVLKDEFEAYAGYYALNVCLQYQTELKKEYITSGFSNGDDINVVASDRFSAVGVFVGSLIDPDDGTLACNDSSDFNTLSSLVGYSGASGLFQALFYDSKGDCKEADDGKKCQTPYASHSEWMNVIRKNIQDKNLAGPSGDNAVGDLSAAGLYWFYNKMYRKGVGEYGGCGGVLTNQTEDKYKNSSGDNRATSGSDNTYANVSNDGTVTRYDAIVWSDKVKAEIERVYSIEGHHATNYGCETLAGRITMPRARAYQKVLIELMVQEALAADPSKKPSIDTCVALSDGNKIITCLKGLDITAEIPATETGLEDDEPSCSASGSSGGIGGLLSNPLGFVICGILGVIIGTIEFAENSIIIPYLSVSPISQDDELTTPGGDPTPNYIRETWINMRNLANVVLVIAFIVLIYMQITVGSSNNAYNVRKIAPSLVMVAISIQLSFFICSILIDLFNILSLGVTQILTASIVSSSGSTAVIPEGLGNNAIYAAVLGSGIAPIASLLRGGALGGSNIFGFLFLAVVIMLVVVIILVLRQILIVALVVLSPLAMSLALLPNTRSLFKKWFSTFVKVLAMQPIIIGLFGLGKLFGAFVGSTPVSGAGAEGIQGVMSFMANVAPLAAVPWAFKFAGGGMGAALKMGQGFAQNGRKKILDPKSNFLGSQRLNELDEKRRRRIAQVRADEHQRGRGLSHKLAHKAQHYGIPGSNRLGQYMSEMTEEHYAHAKEEKTKTMGLLRNPNKAVGYGLAAAFMRDRESFKQGLAHAQKLRDLDIISDEDLKGFQDMEMYVGDTLAATAAMEFAMQSKKVGGREQMTAMLTGGEHTFTNAEGESHTVQFGKTDGEGNLVGQGGLAGVYASGRNGEMRDDDIRAFNSNVIGMTRSVQGAPHYKNMGVERNTDGTARTTFKAMGSREVTKAWGGKGSLFRGKENEPDLIAEIAYDAAKVTSFDYGKFNKEEAKEHATDLIRIATMSKDEAEHFNISAAQQEEAKRDLMNLQTSFYTTGEARIGITQAMQSIQDRDDVDPNIKAFVQGISGQQQSRQETPEEAQIRQQREQEAAAAGAAAPF